MPNFNNKIKSVLKPYCVDYIGFADLRNHQADLVKFSGNIVKGYASGISPGMTIPVSVADRTDASVALSTVSHKMIAHIPRLGWIGKNCLLITPKHGPRLR